MKSITDLFGVRNALEDSSGWQNGGWESSGRKKARAFQLSRFSGQELMALQYVHKERKRVLTNLFQGKEVTLKAARLPDTIKATAQQAMDKAEQAATFIRSIGKQKVQTSGSGRPASEIARQKFEDLVRSLFSVDSLDELGGLAGTILSILGKAALSVPPVVGQIKDGYDLFTGWARAGADLYEQVGLTDRQYALDTGVPASAFAALKSLLVTETKKQAVAASQATASFAVKTGLVFVDGGAISGPVVGAVSALATLVQQLFFLAVEWRATKAINKALTAGELDVRLFRTYPLMGCYLIISGTLSDLIPINSFGMPGWMSYVEKTKRDFDEIDRAATKLVDASPWEIVGLPKRRAGTSASLVGEISRVAGFGGSVFGIAGLSSIRTA